MEKAADWLARGTLQNQVKPTATTDARFHPGTTGHSLYYTNIQDDTLTRKRGAPAGGAAN